MADRCFLCIDYSENDPLCLKNQDGTLVATDTDKLGMSINASNTIYGTAN